MSNDEAPYCDTCGEDRVTVQGDECGYCDDCYQTACQAAIQRETGRHICGRVLRYGSLNDSAPPHLAVCIEPYGTEHDHCQ